MKNRYLEESKRHLRELLEANIVGKDGYPRPKYKGNFDSEAVRQANAKRKIPGYKLNRYFHDDPSKKRGFMTTGKGEKNTASEIQFFPDEAHRQLRMFLSDPSVNASKYGFKRDFKREDLPSFKELLKRSSRYGNLLDTLHKNHPDVARLKNMSPLSRREGDSASREYMPRSDRPAKNKPVRKTTMKDVSESALEDRYYRAADEHLTKLLRDPNITGDVAHKKLVQHLTSDPWNARKDKAKEIALHTINSRSAEEDTKMAGESKSLAETYAEAISRLNRNSEYSPIANNRRIDEAHSIVRLNPQDGHGIRTYHATKMNDVTDGRVEVRYHGSDKPKGGKPGRETGIHPSSAVVTVGDTVRHDNRAWKVSKIKDEKFHLVPHGPAQRGRSASWSKAVPVDHPDVSKL